jgi:uncharacterized protein DUF4440
VEANTKSALYEIEEELAAGSVDAYRRHLAKDALVIVPGQALDRDETVAAMNASPGWTETSLTDRRALEMAEGVTAITYRFCGKRGGGFSYEALMTSVYSRTPEGWRLRLHQQTPLP